MLDFAQIKSKGSKEDGGLGEEVAIISLRGDEFFVDTINPEKQEALNSINEEETQGFDLFWPYIVIKGLKNNLLLFNANQMSLVIRIEMPGHFIKLSKTYMTETKALFIVGETKEHYEMYHADLDDYRNKEEKKDQVIELQMLMSYPKSDVLNAPLLDFHVRAGSNDKKDKIFVKKNTFAFFLHGGLDGNNVYVWQEGNKLRN